MASGSRPVNVRSSEAFMIAARWVSLRSTHPTKRTRPVGWVERSETHHGPSTRLAPPTRASMAPMAYGFRLPDRKGVVEGKSVSVRVDLGWRRIIKKKKKQN